MIVKDLTIEQYMYITLLADTYKDNDPKFRAELVKYIHGSLDVDKRDSDETIETTIALLTEECDLTHRFTFNGVEYGLIPNFDKIKTGEFIDLDDYIRTGTQLHKICSILYRPVVKTNKVTEKSITLFGKKVVLRKGKPGNLYRIEKYEGTHKYADVMKGVDFRIVKGALVFFYDLRASLLEGLDTYTQRMMGNRKKTD